MNTGFALLVSYVLLAIGLFANNGTYSPLALLFLLTSFAFLIAAFVWARNDSRFDWDTPGKWPFILALLVFLFGCQQVPPGIYIQSLTFVHANRIIIVLFSIAVLVVYGFFTDKTTVRRSCFFLALVVTLALRIGVVITSPSPVIDVFTSAQDSALHLLQGKNPYSTPVTDPYKGKADSFSDFNGYSYPPASLYPVVASFVMTGDNRYAYVVAEIVIAIILWRMAKKYWDEEIAELITLLFLFNPRSLYVLEQAWTEPLILLSFAVFLLLHKSGRSMWASVIYGCMLSLKQYLIFFLFYLFILERRWRSIAIAVLVALGTAIPFLIWDWRALFDRLVLMQLHLPFRYTSLTIFGYLAPHLSIYPPKAWSLIVGLVVSIVITLLSRPLSPLRKYLFTATISTYALFLFGTQGFGNYYYFVEGLLLFLLALEMRLPEEITEHQKEATVNIVASGLN